MLVFVERERETPARVIVHDDDIILKKLSLIFRARTFGGSGAVTNWKESVIEVRTIFFKKEVRS